tara:strand:- start:446 stop:757 length:312 start_codon:yes stop_codon:yes gene_type:complete
MFKKKQKEVTTQSNEETELSFEQMRNGEIYDGGRIGRSAKERYELSQGRNPEINAIKFKIVFLEIIVAFTIALSVVYTYSAFNKGVSDQHIQRPDGTIQQIMN